MGSRRQQGSNGTDRGVVLRDHLQIAALGQHSVRLLVHVGTGKPGIVDLVQGEVRYAEFGSLRGEEALRELLSTPARRIVAEASPVEPARGSGSVDLLRRLDVLQTPADGAEGRLEEPPGTSAEPPAGLSDDESLFDRYFEEGVRATLEHEFRAALASFERARAIRPQDPRVLHNIRRLRELGQGGDGRDAPRR